MDNLPKAPCIGENVLWYPHGDVDQSPFAATVTQRTSDECITLFTLSPTGRSEPMLNVRHVNHPYHIDHKAPLRRWGAWDIIGSHEKRLDALAEAARIEKEKSLEEAEKNIPVVVETMENPDENELLIVRLARELGDSPGRAQSIADKIGAGMTHQRVNAILRKFPHFLSGPLPEDLVEVNG